MRARRTVIAIQAETRQGADMTRLDRITIDPAHRGGRPRIRGMRIRVADILDILASDANQDDMLQDFPDLEAEDTAAAIEFAARRSDHPVLATVV